MADSRFASGNQNFVEQLEENAKNKNTLKATQTWLNVWQTLHFIFLGRALWADSVSPLMNTIASRDQFKQIRIGENLMANYNYL